MNWNQLYASSTAEERFEVLLHMLVVIEARQNKRILARGRLIHERRGPFAGAHFLNDRRTSLSIRVLRMGRGRGGVFTFFILLTVSITIWLSFGVRSVASHAQPAGGMIFFSRWIRIVSFTEK